MPATRSLAHRLPKHTNSARPAALVVTARRLSRCVWALGLPYGRLMEASQGNTLCCSRQLTQCAKMRHQSQFAVQVQMVRMLDATEAPPPAAHDVGNQGSAISLRFSNSIGPI